MGTELRLGFALGGGVSLGTFNGAALTEAIKLAVLRGTDRNEDPYDNVVIDVFSGASAGAMSLGIMLRGLVHRTSDQESAAQARLETEHGDEFRELSLEKQQLAVAAQVVQDIQEQIWVHEISLDRLLSEGERGGPSVRYTAGIFNRAAVEDIARKYFQFPDGIDLGRRRLLAERVLFACSLANLTPIVADARKELDASEIGFLGLADGMTSRTHRELRVFDLYFEPLAEDHSLGEEQHPSRWFRYHAGTKQDERLGSLLSPKAWKRIAATSVASGAFPLAFEPVVLERKEFEYGEKLWPKALGGEKSHRFTFVDGGTFNNEPIREAFRMASFIDAQGRGRNFERRIIFVDPSVSAEDPSMRVPVHQRYFLQDPNVFGGLDGYDLRRRSTLDRIVPQLGTLLGAILNEARVVEADKVFQTRKRFQLRRAIRGHLQATLAREPNTSALNGLIGFCREILEKDKKDMMIPAGSLEVAGELRRVIAEERDQFGAIRGERLAEAFLDNPGGASHKELWLCALAYVAVDLVMNLGGKIEENNLIAIAPFDLNVANPKSSKPIPLPGGAIAGFAGFTSEEPGKYETKVAKYCAKLFLEAGGLIKKVGGPQPSKFTAHQKAKFAKDLEEGMEALGNRISAVIKQSHLIDIVPGLDQAIAWFVSRVIKRKIDEATEIKAKTTEYEFRIQVPSEHYELDDRGFWDKDIKPVSIGDRQYLITYAQYASGGASPKWTGIHLTDDRKSIRIDQVGLFDGKFCSIRLPGAKKRNQANKCGYPIFMAVLKEADGDEENPLPASRWKVVDGALPLEETIF